jgi:hypothetical protein
MPRFSRISWKRRDDAEPPRIESRIDAANRRLSEREMVLLRVLPLEAQPGRRRLHERAAHARDGAGGCVLALEPLKQGKQPFVREVARRRDDDVRAGVHRAVIRGDRTPADRRDHLGGADHRTPEGVRAEHGLREKIVDEFLRRVLVHRDLLEHHLPLVVELGEPRYEDHIRHHAERLLDVPVGYPAVDDGVLPRGRGVQLGTHRVERLGDLLRVAGARPLEEEVLDEVRDAGTVVALVARAGADPEAERDGADAPDPLRYDPFA